MLDNHPFIGATDLDSPDPVVQPGFHREARNMIFRGGRGRTRGESMPGTTEIVNPLLPATGVNKTINSTYDPVNHQIIFFNYNSEGTHGIYLYTKSTGIFQRLIVIGADTDGDILGFTPDLITSVNILYNEATDGDLLFYLDTLGRPTCFNIQRYSASISPYAPIKRDYIDLAKAPPAMVPQVTYENDYTATVNNLLNVLFQFKCSHIYDDFQESVLSSGSIVPLPTEPFDAIHDSDPTQNSLISVYIPTGDADVKKIKIWGQSFIDALGMSNYYLIALLNKSELNIPDNDVYRFVFKNDTLYIPGAFTVTGQLQDVIPLKAGAQELLNGNVPAYSDITEGYDKVEIGMNFSVSQQYPYSRINGLLFFAAQGSLTSIGQGDFIKIVLTGTTTDSTRTQLSANLAGVNFVVNARDNSGNEIGFTYVSSPAELTTDILNGIKAAAISAGFTLVSQSTGELVMQYAAGFVLGSSFNTVNTISNVNEVTFAYADQDSIQYGIQYFDGKGRTNGTSLAPISSVKTMLDNTGNTINSVQINITSRPPLWATYYNLVRADEITYNKRLFWISNQTFIDVDLNTNIKYAYIGISYMQEYNKTSETTTNVVSYEFLPGDRVQFQMRYLNNTSQNNLPSGLDYQIQALVVNPILDGQERLGNFLKIVYPTDDISPTFTFGVPDFQFYKILIYNFKKHVQDSTTETFFEFGQEYGIGNPGTLNAYHMGLQQSQTADLVTPAIINLKDGNFFYRPRNVPVGEIAYLNAGVIRYSDKYANLQISVPGGPISTPEYDLNDTTVITSDTNNEDYTSGDNLFFNKSSSPITIRLQAEYSFFGEQALTHNMVLKICSPTSSYYVTLVKNFAVSLTNSQNSSYTTKFDNYILIPANSKVFFVAVGQSLTGVATFDINAFTLTFTIVKNIIIPIIESSFSDNYNIVTNSNSRPSVYDENAKQIRYPTLLRWGLADQLNTNINQTNKFYPQDFDEFDKTYGAVVRLRSRKRELRIFQERRCGRTGIYARFLQSNVGDINVVTTDSIITSNNISYYEGEFGIGNQGASLSSSGFADYFVDPVKGFALRLSANGIEPISEQNRVQTWAGTNLPQYNDNYSYPYGGNAAILGVILFCKDRPSETWFMLQGGMGTPGTIPDESFVFREDGNLWTSFMDFAADSVMCDENELISFKNGKMYSHDNTNTYCNYYGVQNKPSITMVKNDNALVKKSFQSIDQVSNVIWNSDLIYTQMMSYQDQRQESNLVDGDFRLKEGQFHAPLMRDKFSIGGISNGDRLRGTFMVIQLSPSDGSKFAWILEAAIKYNVSPVLMR